MPTPNILEDKVDLYINLEYDIKKDLATITETNVKDIQIDEILEEWTRSQIGKGKDDHKPIIRDKYHIKLGLDLSQDAFYTKSDTGNKGLTAGLILASIGKWKHKTA